MANEKNKDFDRDRLDLLLKLADVSWEDLKSRRGTEWRINLALWGGLGLFSGFVLKGEATVPGYLKIVISVILVVVGSVYMSAWTRRSHRAYREALKTANYYWDWVEYALGVRSPRPRWNDAEGAKPVKKEPQLFEPGLSSGSDIPAPRYFLKDYSRGSQVAITWLFVLMAAASLFGR